MDHGPRTDPHAPSRINPDDYELVLCYAFATRRDGWPIPPQNIEALVALRRSQPFADVHSATNQCDVCGAIFIEGEVWRHTPTGEHVTLGHQCADKYHLARDLSGWRTQRERHIRGAVTRALRRQRLTKSVAMLRARLAKAPGLRDALRRNREHPVLADVLRRAVRFGSVTEAQEAMCRRIATDLDRPTEEFTGKAPEGRVVATKSYDGVYGTSYKMLVAVDGEDGAWKAWGTVPQALFDAVAAERNATLNELTEATAAAIAWNMRLAPPASGWFDALQAERDEIEQALRLGDGYMQALRGRQVRFRGTFTPGDDDPHFARFSRPASAAEADVEGAAAFCTEACADRFHQRAAGVPAAA